MVEKKQSTETKESKEKPKPTCGLIMPISAIDNYTAEHWTDVKQILLDVIESAGFLGSLVSDAEETSIIQKTIVQNVYNNDIVVCDVSGKNPNVMFELGMRLAFDKATIIIKDDVTDYSFDTSPIEHLTYPRGLKFQTIIDFKEKLKNKISATYKKSISDSHYSTFLKSFGEFKVAHLESKEVTPDEYILSSLEELKYEVRSFRRVMNNNEIPVSKLRNRHSENTKNLVESVKFYFLTEQGESQALQAQEIVSTYLRGDIMKFTGSDTTGFFLELVFPEPTPKSIIDDIINILMRRAGIEVSQIQIR